MWYNQIMAKNKNKNKKEYSNSLYDLATNIGYQTQQNQASQSFTSDLSLRRYMISNNRMLLSQLYVEIGLIRTICAQPVDDAYSKLPVFKSDELSPDDISDVEQFIKENGWFETFKQALKWGRLYGGSGIYINVNQKPSSALDINSIKQGDKVSLYACDRWELNYKTSGAINVQNMSQANPINDVPYDLYGEPIHKSRVLKIKGEEAPAILRLQLAGWGMSIVEHLMRPLNQFLKNENVAFELVDEAKIDVYKIEGFNDTVMSSNGTEAVQKQVTLSNMIKSYLNALVLDKEDEYDQKTMSFSGLPEMMEQNRQNIASSLRMPVTKVFGVSSAGFNSGEDDIENYNSMLEGEIRAKSIGYLITIYKLACAVVLGHIPDDIDLELPELRVLSAEQQENVKNQKFNRLLQAYQAQLIDELQFKEACNKDGLLPIDVEVEETPKNDIELPKKEKNNSLFGWFK